MTNFINSIVSLLTILMLTSEAQAKQDVIGILEPNRSSIISSEVTALVKDIQVNIGDVVNQGDQLASLDEDDYALQVRLSESEVALSQAEYKANERQLNRIKGLQKKGNASVSQLDDGQRLFEVSLAQLKVAQARLDLSKKTLAKTKLLAPYKARVSARLVEQGQLLNPASAMFELVDIQKLKVVFYLLENDINHVRRGQLINITIPALNEMQAEAVIMHIAPQQYVNQSGYRVEAIVDNSDYKLRPGFTARISLDMAPEEVAGE
jgi:RND family efflux transporter MFP subunit